LSTLCGRNKSIGGMLQPKRIVSRVSRCLVGLYHSNNIARDATCALIILGCWGKERVE
jgi:hypothetical protein